MKSPCLTCDHHLAGLSKLCARCEKCTKRIRYADSIEPDRYQRVRPEQAESRLVREIRRYAPGWV